MQLLRSFQNMSLYNVFFWLNRKRCLQGSEGPAILFCHGETCRRAAVDVNLLSSTALGAAETHNLDWAARSRLNIEVPILSASSGWTNAMIFFSPLIQHTHHMHSCLLCGYILQDKQLLCSFLSLCDPPNVRSLLYFAVGVCVRVHTRV